MKVLLKDYKVFCEYQLFSYSQQYNDVKEAVSVELDRLNNRNTLKKILDLFSLTFTSSLSTLAYLKEALEDSIIFYNKQLSKIKYLEHIETPYIELDDYNNFIDWFSNETK